MATYRRDRERNHPAPLSAANRREDVTREPQQVKERAPKSLLQSWRDRQDREARRPKRYQVINHDELLRVFGRPLNGLRLRANHTLRKAMSSSGISETTINSIEAGENARLNTILVLAKAYGYRCELVFTPLDRVEA